MDRFFALLTLLTLTGCVTAASALEDQSLRASEAEIEYIRSHDLKPYIQVSIIHEQVVRGMSREDVRFVRGEPKDSTVNGETVTWRYGPVTRSDRFVFEAGEVIDRK